VIFAIFAIWASPHASWR